MANTAFSRVIWEERAVKIVVTVSSSTLVIKEVKKNLKFPVSSDDFQNLKMKNFKLEVSKELW